ncbi:hypothetical protein VPNG_09187 [Cytospora leucostoma]|uniref:Restriction of telomere capping protein 4 n=1 Tax=Cytospora leucostoma TaxID=1230097 RepID=A0A423VU94_9PEZI|nr:hypothetical protein VPNG_09187 [Cytospora leucostoma]
MIPRFLTRRGVEPLLNTIGGARQAHVSKPVEEPEDVTAPPIESSESEDETFVTVQQYQDSSDDDVPARGDIVRSTFGTKPVSTAANGTRGYQGTSSVSRIAQAPQSRSARSGAKRAVDDIESSGAEEIKSSRSGKKAKRSHGDEHPSLGSQMEDGFLLERPKKPLKAGFGKKAKKFQNVNSSRESTPSKTFETPRSMSASVSPEKPKRFKATQVEVERSSPNPDPIPFRASKSGVQSESSDLSDLDSSVFSDPPRPQKSSKKEKPNRRQPKKDTKKFLKEMTPEAMSQKPEFKMPEGYDDFALDTEPMRIDMSINEDPQPAKKAALSPDKASCPMCDEPVDKQWLSEFSKNQRMSIARQAKFCHLHKKRSAKETWAAKGYPDIKWEELRSRIAGKHDILDSLINGKASHFGELHREKIESGKNRTLLRTKDYLTPGYYGLRGMSVMTETIVEMFSALLRERAPKYKLISARGYTGFVQSVMVPELAVKLIQEDMCLDDEEAAREVMRESMSIGEILNDEKRESQTQAQGVLGGSGQEDTLDEPRDANGKANGGDEDVSVDLRIQAVDDSDSDLPSLAPSPRKQPVDAQKKAMDSDSELSSLPSQGKQKTGTRLEAVDSVSELSSLGDL